jgi:hypothetical protein
MRTLRHGPRGPILLLGRMPKPKMASLATDFSDPSLSPTSLVAQIRSGLRPAHRPVMVAGRSAAHPPKQTPRHLARPPSAGAVLAGELAAPRLKLRKPSNPLPAPLCAILAGRLYSLRRCLLTPTLRSLIFSGNRFAEGLADALRTMTKGGTTCPSP